LSLDKLSNKFEVQPFSLQSYETFEELVIKIKPKYLHNTFDFKQFQRDLQDKHKKLETIHMQALKKAMEQQESAKLKMKQDELRRQEERKRQELAAQAEALRNQDSEHDKHLREEAKREAESAAAANKNKWNEAREEAIILFQRLILGRALQNVMFEGKEKRLALIEELLVVSNIKELDKAKEQELLIEQHQQRVKNAFLEALQGATISETLEGLSMELLRFKEEKKVAEFVKKAEEERKKREAEETGRRQAELTLRKRENVLYAEIMKVHQGTVDSYLRKIFTSSIDHLSTKQALTLTKLHQDKVQGIIKDTKRQEVLIKDMVTSLLVPSIDRMKLARKVNLEQQRYNLAVRETLDQAFKDANSKLD
jgi:hypothetical protein